MSENKKVTAAIAAVIDYNEEEEAAMLLQPPMPGMPLADVRGPDAAFKPWSMNGRQMQMQMRNLMQLRAFQRKLGV